jgi:hypothetical protein
MLEWCSISEMTISSPGPSLKRGSPFAASEAFKKEYATRLNASVEFFVKTISSGDGALMKAATFARAPSYASVASVPSVCTERDTLPLCRARCSRIASITWLGFCDVLPESR